MSRYEPLRRPQPDEERPTPPRPEFFMPAMPPLGLIHALETRWRDYLRRRRFRQHYLPLLVHDDHMLEDMGHCRDDILWASGLPLKEDADQALAQRRAQDDIARPAARRNNDKRQSPR